MGYVTNVEPLLARLVAGTGLLQGGPADYLLALAIAVAFPLCRFALDRTLYTVSRPAAWQP